VILGPGHEALRISARNRLIGTVVRHDQGALNDEVALDLWRGLTITATATRESGETLGFAVGEPAQALIKASHVILDVD
jgi:molybdate transport system regulatory protein